jgi:hypothetical protein
MKIIRIPSRGTKMNLRLDTDKMLLFQTHCTAENNMNQRQNQIKPHNQKNREKNPNTKPKDQTRERKLLLSLKHEGVKYQENMF